MAAARPFQQVPLGVGQERRGRLLDQLLVPALQRAVAGADDHHRALVVREHLGFDVAPPLDVGLDEALAPAERGRRLAHRGFEQRRHLVQVADDPQPAAAATVRGLDRDRQPVLLRELTGLGRARHRCGGAGDQRRPGLAGYRTGLDLVAQRADHAGRRPDPGQTGVHDGLGEIRVLGQETIAGVDGVGRGLPGGS